MKYRPIRWLSGIAGWLMILVLGSNVSPVIAEHAPELPRVSISFLGPHNLSYLPLDLIPHIGADRAEGFSMEPRHVGSGALALRDLTTYNSDFAALGLPAVMSARGNGEKVVGVAAISDAPVLVLMVRADLAPVIRTVADLKGRTIGVTSSSLHTRTVSLQLLEHLLHLNHLAPDEVQILAAGQSWLEHSSLINTQRIDAIMGFEPVASRLLAEGKVVFLADLADPQVSRTIPGGTFLHATLVTTEERIQRDPDTVRRIVAAVQRALAWIAIHPVDELLARLPIAQEEERQALRQALQRQAELSARHQSTASVYSRDGAFRRRQLQDTTLFFQAGQRQQPPARTVQDAAAAVNDRWVGIRE